MTSMRLFIISRTVKKLVGILCDILVMVDSFIFLVDFVILDCEVDFKISFILGRTFLATKRALVDMEIRHMKFRLNDEQVTFSVYHQLRKPKDMREISMIDIIDRDILVVPI